MAGGSTVLGQNERDKKSFGALVKQNPFVPVGCVAVVVSLVLGLRNMVAGDDTGSQRMMRFRVGSQLFLVGALVAGGVYIAWKPKYDQYMKNHTANKGSNESNK